MSTAPIVRVWLGRWYVGLFVRFMGRGHGWGIRADRRGGT